MTKEEKHMCIIMLANIYARRAILPIYILLLQLNFCLSTSKKGRMLDHDE